MTNPARIRTDSLSVIHTHLSNEVSDRVVSGGGKAPVAGIPETRYRSIAGDSKLSKEHGRRILLEASHKRSDPLPNDIAEALLQTHIARSDDTDHHVDKDADSYGVQPPAVATAELSISEPAPLAPSIPALLDDGRKASSTFDESTSSSKRTNRKAKKSRRLSIASPRKLIRQSSSTLATPSPSPFSTTPSLSRSSWDLAMSRPASLLIASLGNPPPYHSTRHSAAHILLRALQSSLSLPPLAKSRVHGGGQISEGALVGQPSFTLYQSSTQMNVSGPPLLKAWTHFSAQQDAAGRHPGLIVLHDEMETAPGVLKLRRSGASARGHNGIKSVQASLQGAGLLQKLGERYVKIGVGIGRPSGGSRESRDVSAYVLGQLTAKEREGLESAAGQLHGILVGELARIGNLP